MEFLTRSIQKTADIAAGYKVGTLVIEDQKAYLQMENGQLIEANENIEVRNGETWQRLIPDDLFQETAEGWPAYAGMDSRMI